MNTLQLRTCLILLAAGLVTNTAWSSQNLPPASATASHADVPKAAPAKPGMNTGVSNERLPGIMNEEDLPAFLRIDPCDTGDSGFDGGDIQRAALAVVPELSADLHGDPEKQRQAD